MANNNKNNLPAIRQELLSDGIQKHLETRLGEKAGTFVTSVLDLCGEDKMLQACDPKLVVKESLKAAGLDLPINRSLGFCYVIPYKDKGVPKPQFQLGYKGYIQLAIRTGQYKHLNAGIIYEGEYMVEDRIKGTLEIAGEKKSDTAVGYFCYMQLINGFEKAIGWSKERVQKHAERFSKSYNSKTSPWKSDFDAMALKTMILQLVPRYGPMTIEMSQAVPNDQSSDFQGFDNNVNQEISDNANQEVIDIDTEASETDDMTAEEKAAIQAEEAAEAQGPDF